MLKTIEISRLFGTFNYKLEFKNNITILTGPNEFGKSTILKIIKDICKGGSIVRMFSYPLDKLEIMTEKNKLEMIKDKDEIVLKVNEEEIIVEKRLLSRLQNYQRYSARRVMIKPEEYEQAFYFLLGKSLHKRKNDNIILEDPFYFREISRDFDRGNIKSQKVFHLYDTIESIRNEIGEMSYIAEQRLLEKRALRTSEDKDINIRAGYILTRIRQPIYAII